MEVQGRKIRYEIVVQKSRTKDLYNCLMVLRTHDYEFQIRLVRMAEHFSSGI